jgi:aspartate/methionine/tyrosine aminotransferase
MPAFQLLYELPLALNSEIISLPVRYDITGKPFIDEKEWLDIIYTQKPDCLLINNPHNPSGIILKKEFLTNLSETANKIGCHIIGDEHYRFLSSQNEILGDTIYKSDENTFVTGSFIKCFGVPGLRIGWCVGPKKALDALQNEKNYTTHTVNPITEWLSYEVLKNTNSNLFKIIKKEWIENKAILNEFLSNSKTIYGISPEGGLVTSLGFKNANSINETNKLTEILLKNGIFTLPLSSMEFGTLDFQNLNTYKNIPLSNINKGYGIRLGLGIDPHLFSQALREIEEALT